MKFWLMWETPSWLHRCLQFQIETSPLEHCPWPGMLIKCSLIVSYRIIDNNRHRTVYRSRHDHPCIRIPVYPFLSFVLTDRNMSSPTAYQSVLFDLFSFVSLPVQVRSITDEVCRTSLRPCHTRMEFSVHSLRRHESPSRSSSDQSRAIRRRKWPSSPRTILPTCRRTLLSSRRSFFEEWFVSAWKF